MTTEKSCSKKCLGILLFISLTANVFLGGVVAGKHYFGGHMNEKKLVRLIKTFGGLSAESQQKAIASVEKDWPAVKEQFAAVREKRDAVKNILVQKDYSEEELDKAMTAVREQVDKLLLAGQVLGKNALGSITPEERVNLIKKLPRPPAE